MKKEQQLVVGWSYLCLDVWLLSSIPDWQKALLVGSTILFVLYLSYYVQFIRTMATILFSWFLLHTASHFKARVRDEESYR